MDDLRTNVEAALYAILVAVNRGEITGDTTDAVAALEAGERAYDALTESRRVVSA